MEPNPFAASVVIIRYVLSFDPVLTVAVFIQHISPTEKQICNTNEEKGIACHLQQRLVVAPAAVIIVYGVNQQSDPYADYYSYEYLPFHIHSPLQHVQQARQQEQNSCDDICTLTAEENLLFIQLEDTA